MKTDAQRVRQLREARAWSQEQLAEIAGINVRTLQRVESSGGGSLETRMALAVALEVTPAQLCTPAPAADDEAPRPPAMTRLRTSGTGLKSRSCCGHCWSP